MKEPQGRFYVGLADSVDVLFLGTQAGKDLFCDSHVPDTHFRVCDNFTEAFLLGKYLGSTMELAEDEKIVLVTEDQFNRHTALIEGENYQFEVYEVYISPTDRELFATHSVDEAFKRLSVPT